MEQSSSDIEKQSNEVKETAKFKESDAGDGTERSDQILTGRKFYLCVLALCLCMFLIALDQMITATVLTTISDHFHEFDKMTWITAAYMMPMGCCAQFWGRISINFGRKWVLLSGMILFEIGSLICAVANSMNMLIVGRAIQGVGSSCIQSLVMIIMSEISNINVRPMVFAVGSFTFVFASVLGPIIGGIFGTYASWRWCFYLNLCCAVVIFPILLWNYHPKSPTTPFRERIRTIDFLDNFLLIASFVLILLGISFGQTSNDWKQASVICCFIIGGLLLIGFAVWNFKYSKYPSIPANIFFNKQIFISLIIMSANYTCIMVCMQFFSIYFENVCGHNAFHTGLSLIPNAIPSCIASLSTGILIKKFLHIKIYSIFSATLLPVAIGLCMLLQPKEILGESIGFQIFIGIVSGMNFQGPVMMAMLFAPKDPGSTILTTALMNFGRSICTALFSNIAGEVYSATLRNGLSKVGPQIQEHNYPLTEILSQTNLILQLNSHDRDLIRSAMTESIHDVFWLAFGVSIACFISTLFMSNRKLPKKDEIAKDQQ